MHPTNRGDAIAELDAVAAEPAHKKGVPGTVVFAAAVLASMQV
jgi:hypothetical protein